MHIRQQKILEAIIESFVRTAVPVGSQLICESYDFDVSPATIRNEMAMLERAGYIRQPHTSAGRVPTSMAYRLMVNQMRPDRVLMARARRDISRIRQEYFLQKTKEKLYDLVAVLSATTENISFATLPDMERVFYLGIGNILKQPEFSADPMKVTRVFETLETDLYNLLLDLDIGSEGAIYIGEENILPEFQSCSLLAIPYSHDEFSGIVGILGATRMDYAYNMAVLKAALEVL